MYATPASEQETWGAERLSTGPLAGAIWWIQEWGKKTEPLTWVSVLRKKENRKKWAVRKIRDTGYTQCLTDRGPFFPQREMGCCCQGARAVGWWRYAQSRLLASQGAWTHFALCQRERKAVAEVMLPWKHRKKQSKRPLLYESGFLYFKVLVNRMQLCCTYTAAQLLALYFRNIQNLIRTSWGPFQPCVLLFGVGDFVLSDHIFYLPSGNLFIHLLCPFKAIVGNWVEWTLRTLESSHFYKATYRVFTGVKSHFDTDMKGLMALFHHIQWGHRELRYKETLLIAKQNEGWELLQPTAALRTAIFVTVKSNIASFFCALELGVGGSEVEESLRCFLL